MKIWAPLVLTLFSKPVGNPQPYSIMMEKLLSIIEPTTGSLKCVHYPTLPVSTEVGSWSRETYGFQKKRLLLYLHYQWNQPQHQASGRPQL